MLRNMSYGHTPGILPYTMQDRYGRHLSPRAFSVAVLENEWLRAVFLLEFGGRLWSLEHKPTQRELLYVNPVFQPANLATRNAWFSGGVEWNIGVIGHCPFTCSPLFAARLQRNDGTPVLRMYEWERIRQVPFQIDACLPAGSPVLLLQVRIANPHDRRVPMYWWSNVAVPETPETRVIVPADKAYSFGYGGGGLRPVPIPHAEGIDVTYPTHIRRSADFFFHLPDDQRPWIAALDDGGTGLVQVSTGRLKGRKLFVWGTGVGGRTWQSFLSRPGQAYIEIQAGLARTQMEYLLMPAGAEWTWLEAYGLMEADPGGVHGPNWARARTSVEEALERLIPQAALEREFQAARTFADRPPQEILQRGSGWGALERLRRESAEEPPFCSPGLAFDTQSLTEEQRPWIELLSTGTMPAMDPTAEPHGYLVQAQWQALLEGAVEKEGAGHWLEWLYLGVMRYHGADLEGAGRAWRRSLADVDTPWARRNLAALARESGHLDRAAQLYVAAVRQRPDLLPLAVECGQVLIEAGQPSDWLNLLAELAPQVRTAGRIRLLEGQAALAAGKLDRVEELFLERPVIVDLREGERSLSHLWFEYHARCLSMEEGLPVDDALCARVRREFPVPRRLDFRMSSESPGK
jgi:hypothetical protein